MTQVRNSAGTLKISEPAFKKRRRYKLTKKGKKFVLTLAAITALISMGIITMKRINDNKAFEQPISAIVETIQDETIFDDLTALNGMILEEVDQIYANVSTYGAINTNDIQKIEKLGK